MPVLDARKGDALNQGVHSKAGFASSCMPMGITFLLLVSAIGEADALNSEPGGQESVDCLLPCLFYQSPVVSSHVPEDEGGGEQPREAGAVWVSQKAFDRWAVATGGPHHSAAETTGSCQVDVFRGVDYSS